MRFLLFLSLGLFCTFAFGQESLLIANQPPRSTSADIALTAKSTSQGAGGTASAQKALTPTNLVDAPSSAVHSSCTQRNGKPCPEWLHKLIGQYPPAAARERWNGRPDGLFTIGNGRRALHPDKKSWMLFAAAHAGMWASTVMAVRNFPTSREQADSEYPAAAVLTGMDLLLFKTISPALPLGPPVYAMIHYSRAALK
jgi:hypothetical protein